MDPPSAPSLGSARLAYSDDAKAAADGDPAWESIASPSAVAVQPSQKRLEEGAWGRNLGKVSPQLAGRRDEDAALPITAEYPNLSAISTQLHAIQPLSLYFLDSATGAAFTGLVFISFRPLITPYRRQSIR